jgi:hypothetical protein
MIAREARIHVRAARARRAAAVRAAPAGVPALLPHPRFAARGPR